MEAKDPKQASFEVSNLLLFSLHPPLGNDAGGSFQFLFQILGTLNGHFFPVLLQGCNGPRAFGLSLNGKEGVGSMGLKKGVQCEKEDKERSSWPSEGGGGNFF